MGVAMAPNLPYRPRLRVEAGNLQAFATKDGARWDTGDYPGGTLSSGHIIAECSGVGYSNVRPLPPLCATAAPPR